MSHTIQISSTLYQALQKQAERQQKTVESVAEMWLQPYLNLAQYPNLEWRQGPGGWRVGIKGTAIDVYTIVGYVKAGYTAPAIAETLPQLSQDQIQMALRYYVAHPEDIDNIVAANTAEAVQAHLVTLIGVENMQKLTGQRSQS